jgi:ABC-type multidrug transport system fused ATPase/permease subunit
VVAYDYPLLGVFWTMLEIFAFFIWIWLLIIVFTDIFRSSDLGGVAKTLWVVFVLIVPLFGVLIYLIARGGSMHERAAAQAQRQDEAFREYVQQAAGPPSVTEELTNLANLRDSGVITEAEFQAAKEKALA